MTTVPHQCKLMRNRLRKKRHTFLTQLNLSLLGELFPVKINVIVMDYCLPSRRIPDAIESIAHPGTNTIILIKDESGEYEVCIQYQPFRYQGFGLYAWYRDHQFPWGVMVKDLLDMYLGTPRGDADGNDEGYVGDALRCVEPLRLWLDNLIAT